MMTVKLTREYLKDIQQRDYGAMLEDDHIDQILKNQEIVDKLKMRIIDLTSKVDDEPDSTELVDLDIHDVIDELKSIIEDNNL